MGGSQNPYKGPEFGSQGGKKSNGPKIFWGVPSVVNLIHALPILHKRRHDASTKLRYDGGYNIALRHTENSPSGTYILGSAGRGPHRRPLGHSTQPHAAKRLASSIPEPTPILHNVYQLSNDSVRPSPGGLCPVVRRTCSQFDYTRRPASPQANSPNPLWRIA